MTRSEAKKLEERYEIRAVVRKLHEQGLSYNQIKQTIHQNYGVLISKSTISYWLRKLPNQPSKGKIDGRLIKLRKCPALAYVIGAVLGDGYVKKEGGYHYAVVLSVKDYDFALEFGKCAAKALQRNKPYTPYWDRNLRRWTCRVWSKELYDLLSKPLQLNRLKQYIECGKRCVAAFIRGFADAEGSVAKDEANYGHIRLINTNHEILRYIRELLAEKFGILSKIYSRDVLDRFSIGRNERRYKRKKTRIYVLHIYRKESIEKFRVNIGFSVRRKMNILTNMELKR